MSDTTFRSFIDSRDDAEARSQLLVDLDALAPAPGRAPAAADVFTRPSLLRRLARRLAVHVPAGTDRLLVPSLADAPLGAALALATGLPFAIPGADGDAYGETHGSERVAVLAFVQGDLPDLAERAADRRMVVAARLAVLPSEGPPDRAAPASEAPSSGAGAGVPVVVLADELAREVTE